MEGIILTQSEVDLLGKRIVDGISLDFKTGKLDNGTYFFNKRILDALTTKNIEGVNLDREIVELMVNDEI